MSLLKSDKKSKISKSTAEVLASLDSLDKEFPANPGLFTDQTDGEEFKQIFEDQIQNREFKPGQIVEGEIIKITDDYVMVDINYKSEGMIPRSEFSHFKNPNEQEIKEGAKIDVYIELMEDKNGVVVLSKDKANVKKVWQNIIKAQENDEPIQGQVIASVKGGLTVDIGIKAFLPGSQLDIRPVKNMDSFVGQTLDFKILKLNHKRGNIVLSRRAILEKERAHLTSTVEIKEGSVVQGIVKNITSYGAFIDLGDRDGLLYITDMSWSRIEHPNQLLKVGDKLDLKILKYDTEKNRISLGLKQMNEEKWEDNIAQYEVGQTVKVKVSSVVEYGAFVVLSEGVEGLVHVNELSWTKKKSPAQLLKVGQELDLKIIDIKKQSRKLSLSLKQTQDNPWLKLKDKYEVGQTGEFEIVALSDFGLFVQMTEEVDGLIRASDISWTETIKITEKYKVGEKVQAQIIDIDIAGEKFALGMKQLELNPWSQLEEKYPIGSRHEVEVTKIVDFGAFVRIEDNIEGLIHISELSKKRVNKASDIVNVGDKVEAEILNIDQSAKKIGLSIRLIEGSAGGTTAKQNVSAKGFKPEAKPHVMENFFAKALKTSIKPEEDKDEIPK